MADLRKQADIARRTCSIEGCDKPCKGRGWCGMHWQRWRRHGDPLWVEPPKICGIPDCDEPGVALGLCDKHYRRYRRTGDPTAVRPNRPSDASLRLTAEENANGVRTCKGCGETKPLAAFPFRDKARNRRDPNCKPCRAAQNAAAYRRRKAKNPEGVRRKARNIHLRKYGLTPEAYEALVQAQDGRCAACGTSATLLVDHDHATGVRRDLLCNGCNCALGHADSTERLAQLIAYLKRHAVQTA